MVANGHREQSQGKCHRKHTADGPAAFLRASAGSGNGEMVSASVLRNPGGSCEVRPRGERSGTVRAHRDGGDIVGRANPTACKTKQPVRQQRAPSNLASEESGRTRPGYKRLRPRDRRVGRFPQSRSEKSPRGGRASRQRLAEINDRHPPLAGTELGLSTGLGIDYRLRTIEVARETSEFSPLVFLLFLQSCPGLPRLDHALPSKSGLAGGSASLRGDSCMIALAMLPAKMPMKAIPRICRTPATIRPPPVTGWKST